jgi:phosphate transport system permease protein
MKRKIHEEQFFIILTGCATYFIIVILAFLVMVIMAKGYKACTWEMVSQIPKGGYYFGKEGGILNAIIGSLYLASGASLLAFLISLPISLFMNIYLNRHKQLLNYTRFFLDILWGIPSIVYGAFGFALMLYLGLRASLLAGIVIITLLIIPIMVRAMDEVLKTVPSGLLETAHSLGSTRTEISYRVYMKQALPGIITAFLLAFGRGIGDAASVLFTAGYTDYLPTSLNQPTATLPLAIFFQLSSPIPEVQNRAYASALILTVIILMISILARLISAKFKENIIS